MAQRSRKKTQPQASQLNWSSSTELVSLVFEVVPQENSTLFPQYTIGLHAWFLDQVRSIDPELSAYLHDGESEKPFTISGLEGQLLTNGRQLQLIADTSYRWYVTALSSQLAQWLLDWVQRLPETLDLRNAPLKIHCVNFAHPPTTYHQLLQDEPGKTVTLTFVTPTSFRRKGHHLPLPWPVNVFHSYLRRWNDFSGMPFEQEAFLEWVDEYTLITRHQLESVKVAAGKKGSVTGFTGAIEFTLSRAAQKHPEWVQLFFTLSKLAPYCGTGHKTTFGLGQTRLGWLGAKESSEIPSVSTQVAQRITELTEILMGQQKRTGGERASSVCSTRATILARQEFGESLLDIAADLEMPYETVKTYAKLARRALKLQESLSPPGS
ncbi:MAG TPA: CRISPR-associated endoribonuclease Cas6 [Cyanobacteria bacterium UBA8543]|nr:CRISPR-associated endoribonuclease Cas6 [Cyanobacteria bacterium UBA8543]